MSLLSGVKMWLSDRHERGVDKIIKDFYMQFNGNPLIKTTQRTLSGREAEQELVHHLQNKRIYTVEKEAIEKGYVQTKRALELFCLQDLDKTPQVKAKVEKVKADLLERAKLCCELREKGADFPEEDMQRLSDLEMKYGNERTLKYLRSLDEKLEITRSGKKSLEKYEEGVITESKKTVNKFAEQEIQSPEKGVER